MSTLTCSSFGTKHSSCESLRRLLRYGNFSTKLDLCGHSGALMIIALKVSDGMDPCLSCTTTWLAVLPFLAHVLHSAWDLPGATSQIN